MQIQAMIFDMDGTLVDSLFFWEEFWELLGARYLGVSGYRPPREVDERVRTMLTVDAMPYANRACGFGAEDAELLAYTDAHVADFYRTKATVKPGVPALLGYLREQGIRTCVATATELEQAKRALCACGLAADFPDVLSCATLGRGKDCPDIYYAAAERLGVKPEDACVVEDSYVALETAKRCGFRTVGVFDKYNYRQDRLRDASDVYFGEGRDLGGLIGWIEEQKRKEGQP